MRGSDQSFSWDLTVILIEVPDEPGIYSIWREDICLYVGETSDLLSRMVLHYQGTDQLLAGQHPTCFGFEAYYGSDRKLRRDALVAELKPAFNPGSN